MTLNEGDLLFTGTPEGVGQVKVGDVMQASLNQDNKQLVGFEFKVE
jgi:2-keto-4-pentenoate hydratase/2-oxohepta-3-ene-1,7-dioic acid hydratase in catechol pathway